MAAARLEINQNSLYILRLDTIFLVVDTGLYLLFHIFVSEISWKIHWLKMNVNTNKLPMLVNQTRYITKASLVFSHLREKTDWISFVAEDWFVAASCLSSSATFTIQHFTTSDTHSLTLKKLLERVKQILMLPYQTNTLIFQFRKVVKMRLGWFGPQNIYLYLW